MPKIRVNYKSDLPPVAVKFKINGNIVDVPDHDFIIRFFVDGSPGTSFECIHKGEEYINCAKTADDTLTCYINNHKFGCGRLCCEFIDLSADSRYSDKVLKTVTPSCLDVVLVEGAGDSGVEVLSIIFDYAINEIASITVQESTASGGNNVVTVTETSGEETTFNIKNGESAYQSYVKTTSDDPVKTEEEWVVSLKGETGAPGTNGLDGVDLGSEYNLVNDLVTGGAQDVLAAEQGKVLYEGVAQNYTKGYFLDSSFGGKPTAIGVWNFTDYIPCAAGNSIVWTAGTAKATAELVFYDSNKDVLSASKATAAQRTITAPSGSAYLRASFTDYYGEAYNSVPVKVAGVDYPRRERMVGNSELADTHIPKVIRDNLYGYLYDNLGYEEVPTDAMVFANMTINSAHAPSFDTTRAIAEFPVKYGYGVIVKPIGGYSIDVRVYTYDKVGISQADSTTCLYQNGVTTSIITLPVPHHAHMCVVWMKKPTDAATSRITMDEAKAAISVKMVKIPDQQRFVKGVNHRGYNSICPENTLPAFRESKRQGFIYVETDMRTTSDGVIVLLHNESINSTARNADGTAISETVNIASITYEEALEYDFGIWKSAQFAGTKIPTLAQFLALCKRLGLHPYLEFKSASASAVVQAVSDAGMKGHVTYLGGAIDLTAVKNIDPAARLAMLGSNASVNLFNSLKTEYNEVVADVDSSRDISAFKAAGIPVEVYTVDGVSTILSKDSYVSGFTSNRWVADRVLYLAEIEKL